MIDIYDSNILPERPLTRDEVAEIYGLSPDGFDKAVQRGDAPQPSDKFGPWGSCRWHVGVIRAWEKERMEAALVAQQKFLKSRIHGRNVR